MEDEHKADLHPLQPPPKYNIGKVESQRHNTTKIHLESPTYSHKPHLSPSKVYMAQYKKLITDLRDIFVVNKMPKVTSDINTKTSVSTCVPSINEIKKDVELIYMIKYNKSSFTLIID